MEITKESSTCNDNNLIYPPEGKLKIGFNFIHGFPFTITILLGVFIFCGCSEGDKAKELSRLSLVSPFNLVESNGGMINSTNLNGKIWVAHFFYTRCGRECMVLGKRMEGIQRLTRSMDDVNLVSISVDPLGDTPEYLKYYAKQFNADTNKWYFLTGEKSEVYDLIIGSFLLPASPELNSKSEFPKNFIHSEKFAVVDKQGFVRAFFDGMDRETPQKVFETINTLKNDFQ